MSECSPIKSKTKVVSEYYLQNFTENNTLHRDAMNETFFLPF